jgi:hypothetical protein
MALHQFIYQSYDVRLGYALICVDAARKLYLCNQYIAPSFIQQYNRNQPIAQSKMCFMALRILSHLLVYY